MTHTTSRAEAALQTVQRRVTRRASAVDASRHVAILGPRLRASRRGNPPEVEAVDAQEVVDVDGVEGQAVGDRDRSECSTPLTQCIEEGCGALKHELPLNIQ
jgi:hypothetical protein